MNRQEKYNIFKKFFTLNPLNIYKEKKGKDKGKKKCGGGHVGPLANIEVTEPLREKTNFGCIMNEDFIGLDLDSHEGRTDEGVNSLLNECKFDIKTFIDEHMEQLIVTETPGNGFHIYFAHNDLSRELLPRNLKGFLPGVDIVPQLFEGGNDVINKEKGDEFTYQIITHCEPDDMIEMPDDLIYKLHEFVKISMDKKAHVARIHGTNKEAFETDIEKVKSLLTIIPTYFAENKTQWNKVGMCLKHIIVDEEVGYKLFDEFSKTAKNGSYAPTRNRHLWDNMKKGYGYTISCLKKMASYEDGNLEAFELWKQKYETNSSSNKMGKFLTYSDLSEADFSDYWLSIHGNNFKVYDKITYSFVNGRWKQSNGETLVNEIKKMKEQFDNFFVDEFKPTFMESATTEIKDWLESINKKLKRLGSASTIKNIVYFVINAITIFNDIFDNNIDLLGFDNGVYDLKNMTFRKAKYSDYVTMSVGYDYKEPTQEDVKVINAFLNKIMPVEDEKNLLMEVLASCLSGHLNENVHFLLGSGRNGKDTLLTTIMFNLLGREYTRGTTTDTKVLTREMPTGANPELASLNKIRLNVFSEPPREQKIRCDMLKLLTGSNSLPARKCHSNNTHVSLHAKHFIMQNRLLGLDAPDEAMLYRTFVYDFPASFLRQDAYDDCLDKTNKYIEEVYYKSGEFIDFMKIPMLHVLLGFYKNYQSNGYKFTHVPKIIQDRSKLYIQDSNSLYGWICENYEESDNGKDFISLKDIKNNLLNSDYYRSLSKTKQNYYNTLKNFKADLLEIKALSSKFFGRKKLNGKEFSSIFINFKVKTDVDIDEKLDDYDI